MALTYTGIAYRQALDSDSPWIVSFVAAAEELLTWAAIPRRSEAHLLGFQRAGNPQRIRDAQDFFSIATNQSPTSLILGLHQQGGLGAALKVEFEAEPEPSDHGPVPCRIVVNDDVLRNATLIERAMAVRASLLNRLDADAIEEVEEEESSEVEEEEQEETDADKSMQEEPIEEREVELGESVLAELANLMSDEDWLNANAELVEDLSKPATIIDGQHRVLGAARCERRIPFNVCAIVDCTWPEQVFQFTVVNYTATGIPDQFITANAALSLTGHELRGLQSRLVQAGVKVVEYELMRVVNFDERSPFFQLVNLTESKRPGLIGYKSMVRLAKAWQTGKADAISSGILENLYPEYKGGKREVRRRAIGTWQRDDWGDFFIAFWRVVHEIYAAKTDGDGHSLWDPEHSQLMVAAVLLQLQAAFLDVLSIQVGSFFSVNAATNEGAKEEMLEKIRSLARSLIRESFPSDFFSVKWKTTSLSTGAGRRDMEDVFDKMIKTKGKFQYANSALVKGTSN